MRFVVAWTTFALLSALSATASADGTTEQCALNANAAQIARDDGKLIEAHGRFIKCAAESCPSVVRTSCDEWLSDVEKRLPSLVFGASQAGRDVVDVQVLLDGAEVLAPGRDTAVDPGVHTVRLASPRGAHVTVKVAVREGEHHRLVSAELPPDVESSAATTVAGPSAIPASTYVLGGVGVAALGFFVYFAARTSSAWHDLDRNCPNCTSGQIDTEHQLAIGSDVSAGVAVTAAAGAVVTYLLWHRHDAPTTAASRIEPFGLGARF